MMRSLVFCIGFIACGLVALCEGQQNGEQSIGLHKAAISKPDEGAGKTFGSHGRNREPLSQALEQDQLVKIQYVNVNGLPVLVQFTYVGPPKILPIATADSYPEGSTINLICTVSGGQRKGLTLSWLRDGNELDEHKLKFMSSNVAISRDEADISILRIKNASDVNSGQYTCTARNPLGEDSTSVKININVELRWNNTLKDHEVGLNQELNLECDAIGFPVPKIQWFKYENSGSRHNCRYHEKAPCYKMYWKFYNVIDQQTASGLQLVSQDKRLRIAKASHQHSGLYECIASNGFHEDLRRVIQVKVRGE